jgi:hypothetical protein
MSYNSVCNKLEELMVELIKKGLTIPQPVIDDLKTCRTLISIYRTEPADPETAEDAAPYLQKVEANLMVLAESAVSAEYADVWQNKIRAAYEYSGEEPDTASKFVSGVPKGDYWIRIKTSELNIGGEIEEMLSRLGLFAKQNDDGYLLVHGKKENVTVFLKEVRQKVGKSEN